MEEKQAGDSAPPGFPGLETILPLLLTAVKDRRLTLDDIEAKLYTNPKRIFGFPDQPDTYIEVDLEKQWTIPNSLPYSKAKWTPFAGRRVTGRVSRVVLRGQVAVVDGRILAKPGYGQNVLAASPRAAGDGEAPPSTRKCYSTALKKSMIDKKMQNLLHEMVNTVQPLTSTLPPIQTKISKLGIKHVLRADMFSRDQLHHLFNLANEYRLACKKGNSLLHVLKNKEMMTLFFEESSRTRYSFGRAMTKLGGTVVHMDAVTSSLKKGESLEDTAMTFANYADVLVIRHPEKGAVERAASVCKSTPVINGGDGIGEHPSQALLDIFTIRDELGTVNDKIITFVGDLKHGRTVHSLVRLLTCYKVSLRYVAPSGLEMPDSIKQIVRSHGISQEEFTSLEPILADSDVLYMTRIQKERFASEEEYNRSCGHFVINPHIMNQAKKTRMIVMHPMPRNQEISKEFDSDPRAAYFRQSENGVYVRMALLSMLLQP